MSGFDGIGLWLREHPSRNRFSSSKPSRVAQPRVILSRRKSHFNSHDTWINYSNYLQVINFILGGQVWKSLGNTLRILMRLLDTDKWKIEAVNFVTCKKLFSVTKNQFETSNRCFRSQHFSEVIDFQSESFSKWPFFRNIPFA